LSRELQRYFPPEMLERFKDEVEGHRLRREIIATMLANSMINRGGPTFMIRVGDQTGAPVDTIAKAYAAARDAYNLLDLNAEVDALDNVVSGDLQLELYAGNRALLLDATVWFIRNETFEEGLEAVVARFRSGLEVLRDASFADLLPAEDRETLRVRAANMVEEGVPEHAAVRLALVPVGIGALDIVTVAAKCGVELLEAADVWLAADRRFHFAALDDIARAIAVEDYYDGLALDRARRALAEAHNRIAIAILQTADASLGNGDKRAEEWVSRHQALVARTESAVADVMESGHMSISRVAVASGLLSDLAGDHSASG
ncbi:MAG: NAD-glutamate dehydrogenase, partial [Pseudomonadota bacterium]